MSYQVLIAAGGTGGHVFPAIAIASALKVRAPGIRILFAGTRTHMEWDAVPKAGFDIAPVWVSGFHRRFTLKNLMFPIKLVVSLFQSFGMLRSFRPDVVIACGGYVSGPVGWMAAKLGIPLVLQEQNSFPGVTNRALSKKATRIYTAFPEAANWFPAEKCKMLGNPVRNELKMANRTESLAMFGFSSRKKTLLVMGGSGGALSINNTTRTYIHQLQNELGLQIIWQCGKNYYKELSDSLDMSELKNVRLVAFIENMAAAYAVSDIVVSRAGAGSIAELTALGKPMILVPSPHVAGDHQTHNARSVAEAGAACLIPDEQLFDLLPLIVRELLADSEVLKKMSSAAENISQKNAADRIAGDVLFILNERRAA